MKIPVETPETCKECSEYERCPFPDLMAYLKDLVHEKFHGNIIIPFKDGIPGKIKKEEIIDIHRK
jgi:hypothetical protein